MVRATNTTLDFDFNLGDADSRATADAELVAAQHCRLRPTAHGRTACGRVVALFVTLGLSALALSCNAPESPEMREARELEEQYAPRFATLQSKITKLLGQLPAKGSIKSSEIVVIKLTPPPDKKNIAVGSIESLLAPSHGPDDRVLVS